ncbi:MAG: class I SAM-dependent methyltransferase [Thermoleophilia bacterium]|nr:class I SAM-dependent methyltransferase [Thermoleophilia bacterium]
MELHEQIDFLHEVFDPSLPRLGPGDDDSTARAVQTLLPERRDAPFADESALKVLDVGCGNGASTIRLARLLDAHITAIDDHQPYLDELVRRASAAGVTDRVEPMRLDMAELKRGPEVLPDGRRPDLIWSEGALYCMGFADGLAACHSLLAPGGAMGVSELCWFRPDPPAECLSFFTEEYPPMTDIDTNLAAIRAAGFDMVGHFSLPEPAWRDQYYAPVKPRLEMLGQKYAGDAERMGMLDMFKLEIDMYERFSDYYGYEFFLMKS